MPQSPAAIAAADKLRIGMRKYMLRVKRCIRE
jgi:hypothetical protein